MKAEFICHKDYAALKPVNVFFKELKTERVVNPASLTNRHILFRKKHRLGRVKKAVLQITADDYYKLYVNGKFVTQGPSPSYPSGYFYNEIDISGYLKEGENTFAVHTYYQGLINRVWVSGDLREMMYFRLICDGKEALVSDTDWKCAIHTGYTECGRFGYDTQLAECYDSASPEAEFYLPEFDDSLWENASVYENADYTLIKQPTKQLDIYSVRPVINEKRGDTVFLDFGRETVGYLYAEARGSKGDTVILRYGEELNADGSVRYEMRCNCKYEEKWLLSGKDDTLMQYDYKAFRYAEITVPCGAEIKNISMTVRHYPYAEKAVYKTENADLMRVIRLCADTVKYGTQEQYLDCPTREKGQYLGDVSIAARAQAVLTGDTALMKKAISEFCRSTFICKGMMAVSSGSLMQEIADYSLQIAAQVTWVYSVDRDIEFLKYAEPYVTGVYRYFLDYMRDDGLIEGVREKWNLVDWPANLRDGYDFPLTKPIGDGVHNVLNAFWCGFLSSLDELYLILGKEPTGLTEKVKASFKKAFYSEDTGLYCDSEAKAHSSLHSNALPLLFGIGTEDGALKARIIELIKEKGLSSAGVYIAYFVLAALVKNGERALAEALATDERCWINMLNEGATTLYEAWGKDQKWNTSLCHPWAAAPAIVFAENVRPY